MRNLSFVTLPYYKTSLGLTFENRKLYYEVFGKPLHSAPVVVVNHALTGNSTVAGETGWWKELIGTGKTIDTDYYTVIAFNIPGNGYAEEANQFIEDYTQMTVRDVARMFWLGLNELRIQHVHTVIGGSLGGAIAWEMSVLEPQRIQHLIPIATDWKATDWLIANIRIQELLLEDPHQPLEKARAHAMLLYRTPESLNERFQQKKQPSGEFEIESWLDYHGHALRKRFDLRAYKLMNHLLKTIHLTEQRGAFHEIVRPIQSEIHLVAVTTDYFFLARENRNTYETLKSIGIKTTYHEIESLHGHDAFLIEFEQLSAFLHPVFSKIKTQNHVSI